MTASQDPEVPIWLFDGHCGLCSWAVRYTLKHEREPRIRFVAITSDEGQGIALRHGIDSNDPRTFLFIECGQVLAKSDAAIAIAKHLTGPSHLFRFAGLIPRSLRDWLYDRIARHRYRVFGRMEACEWPDPVHRHRFVLPEKRA